MGGPAWTDERVKDWIGEFMAREGRFPTTIEMDNQGGPTTSVRRRHGRMPGIAALVGVDPLSVRQIHTKDSLTTALQQWEQDRESTKLPKDREARRAFSNQQLKVHPRTLTRHLGKWDEVIHADDRLSASFVTWAEGRESSIRPTRAEAIDASRTGKLIAHPKTVAKHLGPWTEIVDNLYPKAPKVPKPKTNKRAVPANNILIDNFLEWDLNRNSPRPPTGLEAIAAAQEGLLVVSPYTLMRRLGRWSEIVDELHPTQSNPELFNATDAVGYVRRSLEAHPDLPYQKALRAEHVPNVTPAILDVAIHFPNNRELVEKRLSWEKWGNKTDSLDTVRARYVGLTALSLAINPGSVETSIEILADSYAGPRFSDIPIDEISGRSGMPAKVWLADQGHQVLEGLGAFREKRRDIALNMIDPIFVTELHQQPASV